jgi:hypothetical protein
MGEMTQLLTVTGNVMGAAREETLLGRDYLVVPLSLIVEGVLNGSRGAILYTSAELAKDPAAWNGVPLVLHHPMAGDGIGLSAREPEVLKRHYLGLNYRTKYLAPRLASEGWFDKALITHNHPTLLTSLRRGERIELSTGLYLDAEPAPPKSLFNNVAYDWVGRNYRPDHVAILPDQVGACSTKDGCGVNVNQKHLDQVAKNTGGKTMRDQLINWLTTNCACWKDRTEVLNQFSDNDLQLLKTEAEQSVAFRRILGNGIKYKGKSIKYDQAKGGIVVNKLTTNDGTTTMEEVKEDNAPDETPKPTPTPAHVAPNLPGVEMTPVNPNPNPPAGNQQPRLTVDEQEDLAWARAERQRQKNTLVERLVGNVVDVNVKQAMTAVYNKMGLVELQTLVAGLPVITNSQGVPYQVQPNYPYQPGTQAYVPQPTYLPPAPPHQPTQNEERDDFLQAPVIDWAEVADLPKKQRR